VKTVYLVGGAVVAGVGVWFLLRPGSAAAAASLLGSRFLSVDRSEAGGGTTPLRGSSPIPTALIAAAADLDRFTADTIAAEERVKRDYNLVVLAARADQERAEAARVARQEADDRAAWEAEAARQEAIRVAAAKPKKKSFWDTVASPFVATAKAIDKVSDNKLFRLGATAAAAGFGGPGGAQMAQQSFSSKDQVKGVIRGAA
jgi:hypothetical protein